MSDTEWRSAPWNQVDDEYVVCPDCCGDGGIYYNEDGDDITKNEYLRLSEEEKKLWEFEECSICNGSGEVIKEAEERIDAELAFAKAIQHAALPSVFPPYPERKEFEIFASMHTAKEVGGDFYDFYFVDDENLAFLMADVSGKGIPAAMFMMTSKTFIKSYAESGVSVEEVFTYANAKLCEGNDAGMFVTAWMGILNTKTGKVLFANAGHNPPLLHQSATVHLQIV